MVRTVRRMELDCFECHASVGAADLAGLGDALVDHARSTHQWPYPDQAIRNYAEATQRLTGPADRLPTLGVVDIQPVTPDRVDDWVTFFERDGFVGRTEWADCFCTAPLQPPGPPADVQHWTANRDRMAGRLRRGESFGYLAYVDGRPAGWVNASRLADEPRFQRPGSANGQASTDRVIGVACFVIAPPYRRHGLAGALLDRVIADAGARGARSVQAFPLQPAAGADGDRAFRGPQAMFEARRFELLDTRELDTVVELRLPNGSSGDGVSVP
jgi:GNAT superfamily N-acetyltransferase